MNMTYSLIQNLLFNVGIISKTGGFCLYSLIIHMGPDQHGGVLFPRPALAIIINEAEAATEPILHDDPSKWNQSLPEPITGCHRLMAQLCQATGPG